MSNIGKHILSALLLFAGMAMLGFTACGLILGVQVFLNTNGAAPVALLGLGCAVVGVVVLRLIYRAFRALWPELGVPRPRTPDSPPDAKVGADKPGQV